MHLLTPSAPRQSGQALIDGCGRRIDHLRLSITQRCNLACRYCSDGLAVANRRPIDVPFAVALVRWLSDRHGVRHVRLTGGEPLSHPRLIELVGALSDLGTLNELTLTTNGQTLARRAAILRSAGLARINVSLDTLNADRFARLTRGGVLARTLDGIEAALSAGLAPVRLNAVVQRGVNDDEICALANWSMSRGCTMRFLEMMPVGPGADALARHLVPASDILEQLDASLRLHPISGTPGQPAQDYAAVSRRPGGPSGRIGIIASTTRPFCEQCRRLRITSRGNILSCLFDTAGSDLAQAWNGHDLNEQAADTILQAAVLAKPRTGSRSQPLSMMSIGG